MTPAPTTTTDTSPSNTDMAPNTPNTATSPGQVTTPSPTPPATTPK
jgi:hypothetical protein